MFDITSRYYQLETVEYKTANGELIAHKRRRFVPPGDSLPLLVHVSVASGDRLDLIAARTIGAAEQYWRIADANNAMHPAELTAEPGRVLRIPIPQAT